ncbi:Disease resistance protein RPP13 [Abeliophyllum distichum]|uniref:Disease resistance protein RPP13 n=1 Tax=Abeliophyllum distichum TaxID=126358 RepID=A0ABD1V3C9_9LAMI
MSSKQGDMLLEEFLRNVIQYIYSVSSPSSFVIDALNSPEYLNLKYIDIDGIRKFLQDLLSFEKEVKVFFKVPNQQMISNTRSRPTPNPNQVVAAFINFLLLMLEFILRFDPDFIACVKGSIQILRTELGFLITFLGDTAMHLLSTNNILIDIEVVVNEVGSFFFPFFFTTLVIIQIIQGKGITDSNSSAMNTMTDMVNEVRSFLHADFSNFLEVPTTEVEEAKNAMTDIKALVNEVGSFLVPDIGILDLALSDLLPKFELLIPKIKEHCIRVSYMPSDLAPNTALVSLFIFDSVLDDLMYLINNKSDRIVGVNDQIVTLHEELLLLGSSVTDIAVQQEAGHEDILIRAIDIAYEVEYVINSFPHVWYLILRLPQLIEKVQLVKNKIDVAGVPKVSKYPGEQVSLQSKEPPILEDNVVGFDKVATEIAEQLVGGTQQLQLISIFGMPGLGKTTLANKVYNNPSVVYHFYERAMCVISQTYNKKDILVAILRSIKNLTKEKIENMDEKILAEDLYKSLKGMRYLIVMDDIWDTEVWDDLKRYFPDDGIGSRILITTRNKEIGLEASPRSVIIALPFLSEDECWELLQRKVFQDKNCPQELLGIGKQIAANCRGLPLAVVVIAGVLANMEKKEHLWQKVARNLSSHLSQTHDKSIQLLELSYKHLPMHLRPCFLSFGAFEEDTEIPVRKLISLWVAEGFVKKEEQKSLEDVAIGYLMKLIDRSLVLVVKRRFDGGVKTCKIHDLLREMCSRIAEENNFLKVVKVNVDDPLWSFSLLMYQQQHRLIINNDQSHSRLLHFGPHVRSLLCCFLLPTTFISCSCKLVRVLDFCKIVRGFSVNGIENLVHLRYLTISGRLPPMESFQRLQCVVVHSTDEIEIPNILLNMLSLRHMHFLDGGYFSASCFQQATNNESFQINNNLESISVIRISNETDLKMLACSPNLRRLKVSIRSSLNYSFDFLNQLESLKLESGALSSSFFSLPLNLKQLTLADAHISPEQMEIIGKLEYLEVLKLQYVVFEGEQWDTSEGGFPQLKFLKLYGVKIAEWNAECDHFPRLQQLVLEFCNCLKMIPPNLGDIPTLQKIVSLLPTGEFSFAGDITLAMFIDFFNVPRPLQVMHKAEKKYEIGKVTDEEEAKQRQMKAILNKLTPQNFEKLFEQVKQVNIDNVITLSGVISQIFDKALTELTFCEMYANFCFHLATELPDLSIENKKITLKRLLLNKCEVECERG